VETGLTYLAIAYGGFFALLAGYVFRIARRNDELQASVEALEVRAAASTRDGS
jgi:hypothetical protein|tara:strand:+ start:1655 stop:1813 length:159 start_codon:yes stop_codon:yes gene_type:complete